MDAKDGEYNSKGWGSSVRSHLGDGEVAEEASDWPIRLSRKVS